MTVKNICDNFLIDGDFVGYQILSGGNINQTFLVTYLVNGKTRSYVIQKINKFVFKNPISVMENIVGVSSHIAHKLSINSPEININRKVLRCVLRQNSLPYFVDDNDDYWRCYIFVDNSLTFDNPSSLNVIEQAGEAFGEFQELLSDYTATSLNVTIPDFHNTKKRYFDFENSIEDNRFKRKNSIVKELEFIKSRKDYALLFSNLIIENSIPLRVTHNDTKCNNVLFDKNTLEALTVVDLDTVMPGLTAYDYGDAIRSIASTTDEDEVKIDLIDFNLKKFEAFTKGFLNKLRGSLTQNELDTLSDGILVMTIELAMRFLKDYLDGDVYFKTQYIDHNLIRARNQITLAKKIEEKMNCIKQTIKIYS